MRSVTIAEVLETYQRIMQQSGGLIGIRDFGALESALAQPYMTFGGNELYPSLAEKASALGFSLIQNHPFIDGNKRTGHAAMAIFLAINGYKINASINEQFDTILSVASGKLARDKSRSQRNRFPSPVRRGARGEVSPIPQSRGDFHKELNSDDEADEEAD